MLITCKDGARLLERFEREGIKAAVIGRITADKGRYLKSGDEMTPISPPGPDELYKVF